jgi:uncharacterized repeat protein (TIGR03806 family)
MSGPSSCARPLPAALSLALSLTACGGSNDASSPPLTKPPAVDSLERLGLFEDAVAQAPKKDVVPYDVIAPLYADEAEKLRFMVLPKGKQTTYDPTEMWDYPDGTRFVKTFFYYADARDPSLGRRLLETRIVEREGDVWTGRTYVWNDAQTEAIRLKVGRTVEVNYLDADGAERSLEYRVPNDNECKTCHSKDHVFEPLGPRTRELDHVMAGEPDDGNADTQVDRLASLGLLGGEIPPRSERLALSYPYGTDPLVRRARSYLDANCSHCHRPGGEAGATALDLRFETESAYALGSCRTPVAAGAGSGGFDFDIEPGLPERSIMVFRMSSTSPKLKMPQIPTVTADMRGVALISEWIASLDPQACR